MQHFCCFFDFIIIKEIQKTLCGQIRPHVKEGTDLKHDELFSLRMNQVPGLYHFSFDLTVGSAAQRLR